MKIIGKTEEGFMLSATADELAKLLGLPGEYSIEDRTKTLVPGKTIKVADLYKRLERLGHLPKEIESAQKALRGIADALEIVEPLLVETAKTETALHDGGA